MSTLATEVTNFHQWANFRHSPDYRPDEYSHSDSEWECDYPEWPKLYAAVHNFLEAAAHRPVMTDESELLLYVLARDNEDEVVLEKLEKFPEVALQVVQAAVTFPDSAARWQAAVLAGRIGALDVVSRFLNDSNEYVRRRADFVIKGTENKG